MDVNTFGEYVTIVAEEDGVTIIGKSEAKRS